MHRSKALCFSLLLWIVTGAPTLAGSGVGQVKIGYTIMDEEGNLSVNQSTFNCYEGFDLSLEKFRYGFDNGMRLSADLQRLTLNNRNLNFGLEKSGLFGVRMFNNQYRRIYDFDGGSYVRRHRTGTSVWINPHRYIRLFSGGEWIGRNGRVAELFDAAGAAPPEDLDYDQHAYNFGLRVNYYGRMVQAEYKTGSYTDNNDATRDQKLSRVNLVGIVPVPRYEWAVLSGGFRHFETKYKTTDFAISSNNVWGGIRLKLPENFDVNYYVVFDRSLSDSDYVATDNISNTFYVTHTWPGMAGLTAGYQHDINDDFEDEVQANSMYSSGWLMPLPVLEFRGEYGYRSETVEDGSRLLGDADRNRFKISGRYSLPETGSLTLKFENKIRKNDQLGSKVDFSRVTVDNVLTALEYADLTCGYSFSKGKYRNEEQVFEFRDHLVHGDITFEEYHGLTTGFGAVYYRSHRDLDVEHFTLRFSGSYRIKKDYLLAVVYNVDNFDDFLVRDQYYTANIVEISLTKILSY
nr:hypothetical protein [candidate division Zixibacteria bacterium]